MRSSQGGKDFRDRDRELLSRVLDGPPRSLCEAGRDALPAQGNAANAYCQQSSRGTLRLIG
ncbi:MAG: hypothetical protein ACKO38_13945 [Planctomycetota bacterium]